MSHQVIIIPQPSSTPPPPPVCPYCKGTLSGWTEPQNKKEADWGWPEFFGLMFLVFLAVQGCAFFVGFATFDKKCRWPETVGHLFAPGEWVGCEIGKLMRVEL